MSPTVADRTLSESILWDLTTYSLFIYTYSLLIYTHTHIHTHTHTDTHTYTHTDTYIYTYIYIYIHIYIYIYIYIYMYYANFIYITRFSINCAYCECLIKFQGVGLCKCFCKLLHLLLNAHHRLLSFLKTRTMSGYDKVLWQSTQPSMYLFVPPPPLARLDGIAPSTWKAKAWDTEILHMHTHTHIYIYIYIYISTALIQMSISPTASLIAHSKCVPE